MAAHSVSCWSCGHTGDFSPPLERADSCQGCRRDAKCCLNCRFYDRQTNQECSESQAELVKDKEKSNFCDWFAARSASVVSGGGNASNPLDQLFGGVSQPKEKSSIEDDFESFFSKK